MKLILGSLFFAAVFSGSLFAQAEPTSIKRRTLEASSEPGVIRGNKDTSMDPVIHYPNP